MKHSSVQFLAILSILIHMPACAPAQVQVLPTKTNIALAEVTSTSETNIVPTQIASSIPSAIAELTCPKINSGIQFNHPKESSGFQASILHYLNEGGDPAKIESMARTLEIQPYFTLSADIDSDLLPEVVVSTRDFFEDPVTIRIYHCEQNDYRLVKSFTPDDISFGIPEFTTKIFDSEPPFMIIRIGRIVGWGQDFSAIGWHNSEWQIINLATGAPPSEIAFFDQNTDGTKEVFIKTKTATTRGGGISRIVVDSYSWDGKEFVPIRSDMTPGYDRVHYLDDAETAWRNGNPLLAVSYYEIAARDSKLSSYWTTYEVEHNQTELAKPYQQAFAFFRIVTIWYYLDRPEVASVYLEEMSKVFPKENPGSEFVLAAQALSTWYEKDPDISRSCTQAVNLLDTEYPDIVTNHLGDWGIAHPMYFATSDICMFK